MKTKVQGGGKSSTYMRGHDSYHGRVKNHHVRRQIRGPGSIVEETLGRFQTATMACFDCLTRKTRNGARRKWAMCRPGETICCME